jgi:hypothetical protein
MNSHPNKDADQEVNDNLLYQECMEKAEGDKIRAMAIYSHRKATAGKNDNSVDLDRREKWPMLVPLLILYTIGTIGVLALVFGFLANRLNWW